MSRDIIELSRGLFKNRGLNRGKSVLHNDKNETILKIFKRDDLYDEEKINENKEEEKEKEIKKENSSSSSSSSSSEPKSSRKEKIYEGSDTNFLYNKYKDYFKNEEEFMKLLKTNENGFYITQSIVKNYLKSKKAQ